MLGSIALRRQKEPAPAMQALDERIHALEITAEVEKEEVAQEAYYSERDLAAFYQDVLANPFEDEAELQVNQQALRKAEAAEDSALVQAMYERFNVEGTSSSSEAANANSEKPVQVILSRLESIVLRLEATERLVGAEKTNFPISILTFRECEALVRVSARAKDAHSAELTLDLMKRTGLPLPEAALTSVLHLYARLGNSAAADRFVETFLSSPATEDQRHFHIQAHIKATPKDLLPTSALDLLHSYESQNIPAPIATYTSVISTLFHLPSSIARGQAWDLFSHMRYVAHPDPSVDLYTVMISACAYPLKSSLSSEPEKALDLWTEMTVDHRLVPTVATYNAVILACARDGTKEFVSEAFRLARQMLDSHRDAHGQSAYRPDRKTFCALLEGAKRIGDLARVRWILAEMTKSQEGLEEVNAPLDSGVNEEVMMHVFNAYAAFKPPFIRAKTVVLDSPVAKARNPEAVQAQQASSQASSESEEGSTGDIVPDDNPSPRFSHIPPQTHSEVLGEVKFLFQSIRDSQGLPDSKFRGVKITPRLITAYLSVFYNHSSLRASSDIFRTLFEEVGVPRTARAYVEALERCANARKTRDSGSERDYALSFAEELWRDWVLLEANGKHPGTEKRLDARTIERANAAMIRVLTLNNDLDRAMDSVRAFAGRYKPENVRRPPPKPLLRSTRTILGGASRPLVRMTGMTEVPDDYVPPVLLFKDLEVLHHRLVAYGRVKDIAYIKWLTKAYEWALRVRRDESTKFVPRAEAALPVAVAA
ncbi:hypothetical protein MD484_g823, partial [Candolleomyces efflorescens]